MKSYIFIQNFMLNQNFWLKIFFFDSSIDNWIDLKFLQKRHIFKNYYRKKYIEIEKTDPKVLFQIISN